ncbi:MAG: methyltransferase domain-containing protein [Sandaracinaceae bacterium]|jgi:hypothetical protein|nr:methyltransferase domain-containing protein [Sandaracinaceae bacterium]
MNEPSEAANRREFVLGTLATLFLAACGQRSDGRVVSEPEVPSAHPTSFSRFRRIYGNPQMRARFLLFLSNVYHILPETELHRVITQASQDLESDHAIYLRVQRELPRIRPLLASVRYALPALAHQKTEIARETARLVGNRVRAESYVEIGTPGRYVNALRREMHIGNEVVLVHVKSPEFSLEDIAERGQLRRVGEFTNLNNYEPLDPAVVPMGRVDFITNYIGLHHAPRPKLDAFVDSIREALRPGGVFVLRDHDVDNADQDTLVALAHDVFNAGLEVRWAENEEELRHFQSAVAIEHYLAAKGFRRFGDLVAQPGDPTKNLLFAFERV